MRLSGFASGLDIDAMVKELMTARRTTYDNMVKDRTKLEWKREDYRTISSKIIDFRNNKLASFNLSNSISAKKTDVSGAADAIVVNTTTAAAAGSLNVKVDQIATSENHVYTFGSGDLGSLNFTEDADNTNNVKVTINGQSISLAKTSSISDLANVINAKSSTLKTSALYDSNTGRLSLTATQTGENKLVLADAVFATTPSTKTLGKNAEVTINGIAYEQESNRFAVNGFDFTVKATTGAAVSTLTAVQDTNKIIETIKSFVMEYNTLIGSVNTELSEASNRSYKPLSSAEKKEMTEDEVKKWEEKARSGTLRNEASLSQMMSDFRIAATSLIAGITDSNGNKMSIGITTGSYTEKGKLVLDEAKLRKALEENASAVTDLFTNSSTGAFQQMTKSSMTALKELAEKAGTSLANTDLNYTLSEDSVLGRSLREMNNRERAMLDRLNRIETQYYKRFTAMESAINRYNSQSSSLSSFMSK
ncbi:flagellar filament capping protein FliD [Paenibacillus sp. GCM10027627]|uniref:flagellar filament capping protein FliD n=1 Tax=unclassified Paenibacillus TaxID=185978 RepID=UPI0036319301